MEKLKWRLSTLPVERKDNKHSINFSSKSIQGLNVSQGPQLESVCYKTMLPSAYCRQVAGDLD